MCEGATPFGPVLPTTVIDQAEAPSLAREMDESRTCQVVPSLSPPSKPLVPLRTRPSLRCTSTAAIRNPFSFFVLLDFVPPHW